MVTAKMNINYSEVYKLILNSQIPKYHISKGMSCFIVYIYILNILKYMNIYI